MLNDRGILSALAHSMDHWFAPVKRCGETPLHCSTSHATVAVRQKGRWCLNIYHQCANAHQTWRCRRQKACKFEPRAASNLVCWFDKRDYQVFWMLSHAVALSGHWRGVSDVVNVKDGSWPAAVSTPCMETGPGQRRQNWFRFSKKWIKGEEQDDLRCSSV